MVCGGDIRECNVHKLHDVLTVLPSLCDKGRADVPILALTQELCSALGPRHTYCP